MPFGNVDGETRIAGHVAVIVYDCEPVQPLMSVAVIVNGNEPLPVAVPLIVPEDDNRRFGGNEPLAIVKV